MKKYILILLVLLGFEKGSFGQTGASDWKWQNPLPEAGAYSDVFVLNSQTAYIVGERSKILKTIDGGVNWESQNCGCTTNFNSVFFIDPLTGWAVGENGIVLKTTNGGVRWRPQTSGTSSSLNRVFFADQQHGWLVGNGGLILVSSDGGSTWTSQTSGTTQNIQSVQFRNTQLGWAVAASGIILKTIDGGLNWSFQTSGTTNQLNAVHFISSQTGWAVGNFGKILKTIDGGITWENQPNGNSSSLQSVFFLDSLVGFVVGQYGRLIKTTDGGSAWVAHSSLGGDYFMAVHFADNQFGWAVCSSGTIIKTNNASNWELNIKGSRSSLNGIHFGNSTKYGWAVGVTGTILKTSNGGLTWVDQPNSNTSNLTSVFSLDSNHCWVAGESGTILRTTDGGTNWVQLNTGFMYNFYSVFFINDQVGWAAGDDGVIYKSTNGGTSWVLQSSGTFNRFYSLFFIDAQNGWAVGQGGTIRKTNNGGGLWVAQNNGRTDDIKSVQFLDLFNGWTAGSAGTIFKTTNGGLNWTGQPSGTTKHFWSIGVVDFQNACVIGDNGSLLITTDGGINWQARSSGTNKNLTSIHFKEKNSGWLVGPDGTILSTRNSIFWDSTSSRILGNLYEKTGDQCVPGAFPVKGKIIKASPGPFYGISNLKGEFDIHVPIPDSTILYTLSPLDSLNSLLGHKTICPESGQISVQVSSDQDAYVDNNFGFEITPCHHLDLQLSSDMRNHCNVGTTSISYINKGALEAQNSYILVEYPHWVRPVSSSRPYEVLNDSVWKFNLDTVSTGEYGFFTIIDSVICTNGEIIGLSQCTKATIFPAPDCPAQSTWSGAEVSVTGVCDNGMVKLGIYNRTAFSMPDSVDYWLYFDSVLVKQARIKLAPGDSLKMNVDAYGAGIQLAVNQVVHHPFDLFVTTFVEGCNDTSSLPPRPTATRFPIAQRPYSKTQCLTVSGENYPFMNQVFPIGFTDQNIIAPDTRLEYLVRFQNTGNDTAYTVYVIDSLDENLNVESFAMGAASHNYDLSMQTVRSGKTFLRWQFKNIMLPYSNVIKPGTDGFVQFRISPKPGLPLGTKVRNHAGIYFDFNPPVITNRTLTTFDNVVFTDTSLNNNVQIITSVGEKTAGLIGVELYPNPVIENQLTASFSIPGSLVLYDAQGKVVYSKENIEGTETLPIPLPSGFYIARIVTKKGNVVEKILVQ